MTKSGIFFLNSGGETLVHICTKGKPDGAPTVFPVRSVERVEPDNVNAQSSLLFLSSGFRVQVALPPAELQRRLFRPGVRDIIDGILDLRDATRTWAEVPAADRFQIGDSLPDGSVYLGVSPSTDQPLCLAAGLPSVQCDFNEADARARGLKHNDRVGWRLPTVKELNKIRLRGIDLKTIFKNASSGYIWTTESASRGNHYDYHFSDGVNSGCGKESASSVFFVRDFSFDQFGG